MVHLESEDFYSLILEDYFFSQVDRGTPPEEKPL